MALSIGLVRAAPKRRGHLAVPGHHEPVAFDANFEFLSQPPVYQKICAGQQQAGSCFSERL